MPRRNLLWLLLIALVSLVCYQKVQTNRFGRVLADAMDLVERRYLEPVQPSQLFEGAMEGMVNRLGDRYSAFISPKEMPKFKEMLDAEFRGVGMELELDPKTGQLTVFSPLVGTPAYLAGIRAGDKILRINGRNTQGMSVLDAAAQLRGKPGEPVLLSILHEGEAKPVEIKLVRELIQVDSVLGDTHNADGSWNFFLEGRDRIGYLRITTFSDKTSAELRRALAELQRRAVRGLILDLRGNPGGLLGQAVDTCDLLIESGTIVSTRGRDGQVLRVLEASGKGTYTDFPMAVLVNRSTASASEIVAACLQDHRRAVIVGERTWGKGTVQEVIELGDDAGALKLTTATYWRPSGQNIHRGKDARESDQWGVTPDKGYQLVLDTDELIRLHLWRRQRDVLRTAAKSPATNGDASQPFVDRQLAKAVEALDRTAGSSVAGAK